jgi:hypothetical protein
MPRPPKQLKPMLDLGRVLRPRSEVLRTTALVSPENTITPPPNQFTHRIRQQQPYFFKSNQKIPSGHFSPGTPVVLMVNTGGASCWVADGQGLYVKTAYRGLIAIL